jgi:LacI family transcriptional regulator
MTVMNMSGKETRKYLIIAEQLKLDILSGKYKSGENIPALRKLALKYKVTPLTVSKATAYLSSLGYLNIKQGSGGKAVIPEKINKKFIISLLVNKDKNNLDLPINYFYKEIYLSYLMYLNNKNYDANIVSYQRNEKNIPDDFRKKVENTDGVIVLGSLPGCYYKYFEKNDIPLVIIDRKIPSDYRSRIGTVFISNSKLEEAVNYLISLGHSKILYSIDQEIFLDVIFQHRLEVIKSTLENWPEKLAYKVEIFQFAPDNPDSAEKLKSYISKGFKASICYNDISAINLYTLLNILKKSIPSDFSVIGIDDIFPSTLAAPPLTTVRIDRDKLTLKAIEIIEKFIAGHDQKQIIESIETELIIRKSVYRNIEK